MSLHAAFIRLIICSQLIFTMLPVIGCDPDVSIRNEDFDLWCGDTLCGWDIDSGKVDPVATWHRKELGVTLMGNPAAISQRLKDDASQCFKFTVVAKVADNAKLFFDVDFLDDDVQSPELSIRVTGAPWKRFFIEVERPKWANVMRIVLRKTGKGEVILARVADERFDTCVTTAPDIKKPDGITCDADEECASNACEPLLETDETVSFHNCAGCDAHADCAAEEVCGLDYHDARETLYRTCVTPGSDILGERCLFGEECETGICCDGRCSSCCEASDCVEGSCRQKAEGYPNQCAPGDGIGEPNAPCLSDNDCASGQCIGERDDVMSVCLSDGRPCTGDPACPGYIEDSDLWEILGAFLEGEDACIALGVKAGHCR